MQSIVGGLEGSQLVQIVFSLSIFIYVQEFSKNISKPKMLWVSFFSGLDTQLLIFMKRINFYLFFSDRITIYKSL